MFVQPQDQFAQNNLLTVGKGLIDALKYLGNIEDEFNSPSKTSNVVAALSSGLKGSPIQKLTKRENMPW